MARASTGRRGDLEQLPSGSVRAVVFVGTDPLTGRPRYLRADTTVAGQRDERDDEPRTTGGGMLGAPGSELGVRIGEQP
jgi:hypothetical protein